MWWCYLIVAASTVCSYGVASPLGTASSKSRSIVKRAPSDSSGPITLAFHCTEFVFPEPGNEDGGESQVSSFKENWMFQYKGGENQGAKACEMSEPFTYNCHFDADFMPHSFNATGFFEPQGGDCDMTFDYNGYHFDTKAKEPYCGNVNKFEAFGDDQTALCYFDPYDYAVETTKTVYHVSTTAKVTDIVYTEPGRFNPYSSSLETVASTISTCGDSGTEACSYATTYSVERQTTEVLVTSSPKPAPTTTTRPVPTPTKTPPASSSETGVPVDVELRILPLGDSITWGYCSSSGNGYRLQLLDRFSLYNVTYAGTQEHGSMQDNWNEGYPGHTIQYIADHMANALHQNPNVVCLLAGTNDMNPDGSISQQGSDPVAASQRLSSMIDDIFHILPQAVVVVGQLPGVVDSAQHQSNTDRFNQLLPSIVNSKFENGFKAALANFEPVVGSECGGVHPSDQGYQQMGNIWHDAIDALPQNWFLDPVGPDPDRPARSGASISDNGGPQSNIPPPDFGTTPVQPSSKNDVQAAAEAAAVRGWESCDGGPVWHATGKIALGLGHHGNWAYTKNWVQQGKVADGLHLDSQWVRLADMNGDGKADYLWVNPTTGELTCWINNLPDPWSPAGNNGGIIASGAGIGSHIFFADMNGNGKADYLIVDPSSGQVTVYWNEGADSSAANGWRFNPGGVIASGVPHANLDTLIFPDINGDGRADYVIKGEGGSLGAWLNTGQPGSYNVLFEALGGIATGAESDLSRIRFADVDGDGKSRPPSFPSRPKLARVSIYSTASTADFYFATGRDDYLIFDEQGALTGFLNTRTNRDGVPLFINQGPQGTIAGGIGQVPDVIILADLDGDGKDDYAYIDGEGAIWLWYNRGSADTSVPGDEIRFGDIDGDGIDDYISLDSQTGAPTVYLNGGPSDGDGLGWQWNPLNGGHPIASGAGPANQVQFADINGDGVVDYLVTDPETGALTAYINGNASASAPNGWAWHPIGQIATGLGPGSNHNIRFADIDGDGKADYIYLDSTGKTTIYRSRFHPDTPDSDFEALPGADASGIGQRPEEISFYDINGDGKADYIWTRATDGAIFAWLNRFPNTPTWEAEPYQLASGVGTSGANIKWAYLQETGRASYVAVDPSNGAIAAWLNGCNDHGDPTIRNGAPAGQ